MRLYLRSSDRRPDPAPLQTDAPRAVAIGTVAWAALQVVALLARHRLDDAGHGWWVWTPAVGILLGLYGLRYARLRSGPPA